MKYGTVMFNESLFMSLSQFVAIPEKFFQSVSMRKINLKFCTVTSTKDTHQMPKNQISVTESLKM